jgi:hypothetical protein
MAAPELDPFSINCWSGPRCCSTSLMYSFAQRDDTSVLDEPLYASYLKLTGVERPYLEQARLRRLAGLAGCSSRPAAAAAPRRAARPLARGRPRPAAGSPAAPAAAAPQVMAAQDSDGDRVMQGQILGPRPRKVLYAKHISKQKIGLGADVWRRAQHMVGARWPVASHALGRPAAAAAAAGLAPLPLTRRPPRPPPLAPPQILVREPYSVVQSFSRVLAPTAQELGYTALLEIFSELRALGRWECRGWGWGWGCGCGWGCGWGCGCGCGEAPGPGPRSQAWPPASVCARCSRPPLHALWRPKTAAPPPQAARRGGVGRPGAQP